MLPSSKAEVIKVAGASVVLLGDPHLGRRFTNGVPFHRRGQRERLVNQHFRDHFESIPKNVDYHVCMGDLFDRPRVATEDLMVALEAYGEAIQAHRDTHFILLAGNHDLGRDLEAVTSFDIVRTWAALLPEDRFTIVRDKPYMENGMLFCPWHPTMTAADMVRSHPMWNRVNIYALFGHWDIINPLDSRNLVPHELAAPLYITGHDHRKRVINDVICSGSMQPYAHGEDDGQMYRTCTLATIPDDCRQLCLRVVLADGEHLPDNIDALQITSIREKELADEPMSIDLDGFDMEAIFAEAMTSNGVPSEISSTLFDKYRNHGQ